jgi:hypothetical protein
MLVRPRSHANGRIDVSGASRVIHETSSTDGGWARPGRIATRKYGAPGHHAGADCLQPEQTLQELAANRTSHVYVRRNFFGKRLHGVSA